MGLGLTPSGSEHAFLLTPQSSTRAGAVIAIPIPEPSAFILAGLAVASLYWTARHRQPLPELHREACSEN